MIRQLAQTISASQLFRGLDPGQIDTLAAVSVSKNFVAGEMIFVQGNSCPGLFVVKVGLVRVFRNGAGGQQHILHLCGPGHSFAEAAVFADFKLPASAMAMQATQCVMIPTNAMQHALATNHTLCRQMLTGMSMWTQHFVQLLDNIVLRDASERVARILCSAHVDSVGALLLPGPKKDLANHLNLTGETFSRVLRRLSDQGLIEIDANHAIRVIDATGLSRLSELDS
ncbi:Crp/Fnr family transcriptional regulator [Rubripirellula reticaptiva]|uniref:cAMP receptor protein n=1 Tax=Rubripirellula reticaptiva TaxID=2528013 RepID=A0A5C6EE59_9BACT|nr:Crp/Fnr family transcriptional regulator [Rubripirellula reticaptiva]TWU46734.1 cAMP receptor protein [Rubripirellula reticaptiva]